MKKIILIAISIITAFSLCSCESIFKSPPKTQLSDDDFIFIDQSGEYVDVEIGLNEYLYIKDSSAYFYDFGEEHDITIDVPFCTSRNIGYGSSIPDLINAYEIDGNMAAWAITITSEEDAESSNTVNKIYDEGETIEDIAEKYNPGISFIQFSFGYYKEQSTGKWLKLTGEEILSVTTDDNGEFSKKNCNEIIIIAIDIDPDNFVNELCFYYLDIEHIDTVF